MISWVSRHLAGKLAQRLEADPEVESIVGVDLEEPEVDLERTEFVHADIRNPLIAKIIQTAEVDTLVHLSIISTPTRVGGRSAMKEINVIGSLQLFAACQKAPSLRKLVMKSSTAVHEDDAEEVLYRATRRDHHGIFNVAADGVVLLSQAIRICGKLPLKVPLPLAQPVAAVVRRLGLVDFPTDQIPFLVYGRVADNDRLKRVF